MGVKQNWLVAIALLMGSVCSLYAQEHLTFIANKGQWHSNVRYRANLSAGRLFLEQQGFTYQMVHGDDERQIIEAVHHRQPFPQGFKARYHTIRTRFLGAQENGPQAHSPFPYHYNFIQGRDRSQWASNVQAFGEVQYENLYPGIDLKVYSDRQGLKCDWIVLPGADYQDIRVQYEGAEDLFLDDGKLYIRTSINYLVEDVPKAWILKPEGKETVECHYALEGRVLRYAVEPYDTNYTLVIDPPVLVFATYSGSSADNFGFTATYDSRGSLYAAGNVTEAYPVRPNGRYPATSGAFQYDPAGFVGTSGPYGGFQCDMAISKYDSSGHNLLWATYLGGTDNDYPHSLVVDADDRLVVLGSTYSGDFPMDSLGHDTILGGKSDIVLVKFAFDGSALLGATYIGGPGDDGVLDGSALIYNYADNYRGDVQVARNGHIFFASCTQSDSGIAISSNALQSKKGGGYDGLIMELDSSLEKVIWGTYWGGDRDDALYSLRIDRNSNLISGGGTLSTNIVTTTNAVYPDRLGGVDGMILRIDQTNKFLLASTLMGTQLYDQVYFVDFDLKNHVYAYGQTSGTFPIIGNPYHYAGGGQFIVKLDEALDSMLISTTLGSRQNDPNLSPTAFLVDNCYNIYFAGWGSDEGVGHVGSTVGLPVTPDAIQSQTDGNDFYLGVLDKNAQNLIFATFFGGTQTNDHVDGGTSRFDKRGVVYHSVCGSCPPSGQSFVSDIPTTPGAVFPTNLSPRCSNASFKLDFQISYAVETDFVANPLVGCLPLTVNFTNKSYQGTKFEWRFGDGTTDTTFDATHTYTQPGKYVAYLWAEDSLSCNMTDSVSIEIQVIDKQQADFTAEIAPCADKVTFSLISGDDAPLGYFWDFGDGKTSSVKEPEHIYAEYGTYTVSLVTNPGSPCADTLKKDIVLTPPANSTLNIPNVFTPGPDDLNPCYRFDGLQPCDRVKVEIYNRYGQLVFESEDLGFCWDGRDKDSGAPLPAGVYYVIARHQTTGKPEVEYKGTVTLIRD